MKHKHLSPLLLLTLAGSAACVFDVQGLSTSTGSGADGGNTSAQDASNAPSVDAQTPPVGTLGCGWEKTFFKTVRAPAALPNAQRGLLRYNAAGDGELLRADDASIRYDKVLAASGTRVVSKVTLTNNGVSKSGLSVVKLDGDRGEDRYPFYDTFGTGSYVYETHEDQLFVAWFAGSATSIVMRVNLTDGLLKSLPSNFHQGLPSGSEPRFHYDAAQQVLTLSRSGSLHSWDLKTQPEVEFVRSNLVDTAEGKPLDLLDIASNQGGDDLQLSNQIFGLVRGTAFTNPNRFEIFQIDRTSNNTAPSMLYTVPAGSGTAPASIAGMQNNLLLVSSDREIWAVPTGPGIGLTLRYSYTPQFGGLQGVGLSDVRIVGNTNSQLATFVQPCGDDGAGGVNYGIRFLPATNDAPTWLWEHAGFPFGAQNHLLPNAGGYGYRVGPVVP